MRIIRNTSRFRKDFKKLKKSPRYKLEKLYEVINKLAKKETLDAKYKDHSLGGEWKDCRDCHIEGDWVLIYEITHEDKKEIITFHRTGTHSELFG